MRKTDNNSKMYTLRDIKDTIGISRRVVQGYESEHLVSPTCKNHMGHLLYDQETYDRIKLIHEYQWIGFTLKEIKLFIDENTAYQKPHLVEQRNKLLAEKKEITVKISKLIELIKQM